MKKQIIASVISALFLLKSYINKKINNNNYYYNVNMIDWTRKKCVNSAFMDTALKVYKIFSAVLTLIYFALLFLVYI